MPDDKTEQATRDSLRAQGIDPDAELAKFRGDLWQRLAGDKPIDATEAQSIREWLASWPLDAEVVPTARVVLIRMLAMIDLINGAKVGEEVEEAIAAFEEGTGHGLGAIRDAIARDRVADVAEINHLCRELHSAEHTDDLCDLLAANPDAVIETVAGDVQYRARDAAGQLLSATHHAEAFNVRIRNDDGTWGDWRYGDISDPDDEYRVLEVDHG